MKKILAISTSPRRNGNGDTIVHAAAEAARAAGAEVTEIAFRDKKINYCIGCGFCKAPGNAGKCSQKDDMPEIIALLQECDGLIFSTGVYFGAMTAQAKTFIDRLYTLFMPGPPSAAQDGPQKKLLIVMTEGMPRPDADKARAEELFGCFRVAGLTDCDYLVIDGCRTPASAAQNDAHLAAAAEKGAWIAN